MSILQIRANNPGHMTLTGTNTYVLARGGHSLVVDPGPQLTAHEQAIAAGVAGSQVVGVLLTHHHHDHSESAASWADRWQVPVYGHAENPFISHALRHEQESIADLQISVLHTPGHTSDSLSLVFEDQLLTGDTVLGEGTSIIVHPDGQLGEYLASLTRLRQVVAEHNVHQLWPGHGPAQQDAAGLLAMYAEHRQQRLQQIRAAVRNLDTAGFVPDQTETVTELAATVVASVYTDIPPVLRPAATASVMAQLAYLADQGELG